MGYIYKLTLVLCLHLLLTTTHFVSFKGKVVIMRNRNLTSVPDARVCNKCLTLDLSENWIRLLRNNSLQHPTLKFLHLRQNSISHIETFAFTELNALILLDLSSNNLGHIHRESFQQLPELKKLILNNNPLTTFTFFSESITTLDLSSCQLKIISPESISSLPSLETLELSHNLLKSLSDSTVEALTKVRTAYLDNNPWQCDCAVVRLLVRLNLEVNCEVNLVCGDEVINNTSSTELWHQETTEPLTSTTTYPELPTATEHQPPPVDKDILTLSANDGIDVAYDGIVFVGYSVMLLVLLALVFVTFVFAKPLIQNVIQGRNCDDESDAVSRSIPEYLF